MTRLELLQLVVGHARSNGFPFRRWYTGWLGLHWEGHQKGVETLSEHRRYYALLFSRDFAQSFWSPRERMTIEVPVQTFQRIRPDGSVGTVTRKAFTRRVTREDAWRYHLAKMASAEDPLRYIRRFLRVQDELEKETAPEDIKASETHDARFIIDEEDLLEDEA